MKLIIDIDEDVRIAISRMGLLRIPDEMQKKVDKAIQHGVPLEQIRAEIKAYQSDAFYSDDVMMNKKVILEIIDKHMVEGSE